MTINSSSQIIVNASTILSTRFASANLAKLKKYHFCSNETKRLVSTGGYSTTESYHRYFFILDFVFSEFVSMRSMFFKSLS
jgi:hypothetical protein